MAVLSSQQRDFLITALVLETGVNGNKTLQDVIKLPVLPDVRQLESVSSRSLTLETPFINLHKVLLKEISIISQISLWPTLTDLTL